jgi:hypothetical protein
MKEKLKNLPLVGYYLVKIYSWYLRSKNKKFLQKNKELEGKYEGKKCFIIATGPSIKNQDLKQLKGQLTLSVSSFFLHPDFSVVKPAYHIFAASHPPITEEQYAKVFNDAEKYFPEGQNVVISITDKHIVDTYKCFEKQNIFYYSLGSRQLSDTAKIDFTKQISIIQTSPHIAIQLALVLGVKEINLVGCDHDWILHVGETKHFYDEKKSVLTQTGYNEWSKDLGVEFEAYVKLWNVYKRLRSYTAKRDITIINCTEGGMLDLFPRKTLQEAATQ